MDQSSGYLITDQIQEPGMQEFSPFATDGSWDPKRTHSHDSLIVLFCLGEANLLSYGGLLPPDQLEAIHMSVMVINKPYLTFMRTCCSYN